MNDITKLTGNVVTSSMLDKIWLFHGAPGTRKTTVATADIEHTLLGAFEIGYKFIPGIRAVNLTNWHGLKDTVRQLNSQEARDTYKTIVIDTIGLAYKACIAYVCARKDVSEIGEIPYGQGYSMAKNEFEKTILQIPQMGYGLVMIAHSEELNDEKNGVSIKVDIDKRPSSVIKGLADFIILARKEAKDATENGAPGEMSVYAYSETDNPNIEVKSRARFFPKRFEFTHTNLQKALEFAIKEQDKFYGIESVEAPSFDAYKETQVDIKEIQNGIINLATEIFKTTSAERATQAIQKELKGVRVSETTDAHLPALFALRDALVEIKKTA